jgi:hypothetical protein
MRPYGIGALLALVCLAGCGATAAERSARLLSAYTADVQSALAQHAERRTLMIQARLRDVAELEANAMDSERQVQAQRLAWTVDRDEKQLRLFDTYRDGANALAGLRKEQREQLALRLRVADEARTAAIVRGKELGETAEILAALGGDMSLGEQVRFLAAYFGEIRKARESAESKPPAAESIPTP